MKKLFGTDFHARKPTFSIVTILAQSSSRGVLKWSVRVPDT